MQESPPIGSAYLNGLLEPAQCRGLLRFLSTCPGDDVIENLSRTRVLLTNELRTHH